MHEKFQLAQSRRQFARLLKLCAEQEKQLEHNPRPFLDRAYSELSKALRLIDDIKAAAYGSDEMALWKPSDPVTFEPVQVRMTRRLEKIQKLIRDAERR